MLGVTMRVSQVHTLVWAGNVLLLAATGWVGWEFWQTKKAQSQLPPVEWPVADKATATGPRWPGPLTDFEHIWKTPLNGLVPPPPPPPVPPDVPKLDAANEFKKKVKVLAAWLGEPAAEATIVNIEWGGKPVSIGLGHVIEDTVEGKPFRWQLQKVAGRKDDGGGILTFHSSQVEKAGGFVVVEQPHVTVPAWPPFPPAPPDRDALDEKNVTRGVLTEQAFRDPDTGAWTVPAGETAWWRVHGEDVVLKNLKTQDVVAPDGRKLGVKLMSHPGEGSVVGTDRGISKGDLIKSINGVAVGSMGDVMLYLRGEGRGATKYIVVVERDGAERTLTYRIVRRSRA
jgi:hypothetical protein